MVEAQQKSRGRPKKYAGRRPNWTFRLEEKYGNQIKALAEQTGRSVSEVCEQQIVNSFRLQMICDLLEKKNETLTEELHDSRIAFKVAHTRMIDAEKRIAELNHRMDLLMRARATKLRFWR